MPEDCISNVDGPSFRLRELAEVSSTNDVVKRALEAGEPEGLAVRACRQTGGYGRQGRTWASPEGGLYLSLLLRPRVPSAQLPTLSLVTGLAVREAVAAVADGSAAESVLIKWPKDVVVRQSCAGGLCGHKTAESRHFQGAPNGVPAFPQDRRASDQALSSGGSEDSRHESASGSVIGDSVPDSRSERASFAKLCGISLEAHAGGVCVGIGINVVPPDESVDVGGKNRPAYLADVAGWARVDALEAIGSVARAVLGAFAPLYAVWCRQGFAPLLEEYEAHASLTGKQVRIADQAGSVLCEGTVRGIDVHGRLLVETDQGAIVPVSSGEAHILNR